MRRHRALQQLSRDHHHALVVAQRLKRARRGDAAVEAVQQFQAYWERDGREHFREEEEILLPACAAWIDPEHPLVAKVLTDHVRIRHLAEAAARTPPPLSVLHELGGQLEQHVRREERALFPLIEESVPEQELARLVERLAG